MTDQDNHAALWAAISVMLLTLVGCAAHHELAIEARVEREREPNLVATYRMVLP